MSHKISFGPLIANLTLSLYHVAQVVFLAWKGKLAMKSLQAALLVLTAFFAIAPVAMADSAVYFYDFGGQGVSISGTITATYAGGSVYDITDITGKLSDANTGASGTITDPFTASATQETSADGLWWYDNLLSPSGSATNFDGSVFDTTNGVLFFAGGYEINIWGNGGNSYTLGEASGKRYSEYNEIIDLLSFSLVTPEPPSVMLLGTGLLGLTFVLFRRSGGRAIS